MGDPLSALDVRRIALAGRVAASGNYHAREHGFPFRAVLTALARCEVVRKDHRPHHPDGYVSWSRDWRGRTIRVDFDLVQRGADDWILIVTAFEQE